VAQSSLAQSPPVAANARGPVVMVLDPGRARIGADRLLRAVAREVGRDVIRITDDRARDASGTLTIAYEGANRWLVRYDSRGLAAVTRERVARPAMLQGAIARASAQVIFQLEPPPAPAAPVTAASTGATVPPPRPERDDMSLYVAWADEILDPFAGLPPPPRREMAIYSEVIDPFAPPAARRAGWTEVLDPWTR
jgi:hypothetical protein